MWQDSNGAPPRSVLRWRSGDRSLRHCDGQAPGVPRSTIPPRRHFSPPRAVSVQVLRPRPSAAIFGPSGKRVRNAFTGRRSCDNPPVEASRVGRSGGPHALLPADISSSTVQLGAPTLLPAETQACCLRWLKNMLVIRALRCQSRRRRSAAAAVLSEGFLDSRTTSLLSEGWVRPSIHEPRSTARAWTAATRSAASSEGVAAGAAGSDRPSVALPVDERSVVARASKFITPGGRAS